MGNVLITGCSSGFGRGSALDLARAGERVFATMRSPEDGHTLLEVAASEDLALTVHQLDVTDMISVERAVSDIVASAGSLDAVVNNAGYAMRGPIETLSDDEIQGCLDTNVVGVLRVIRAVVPIMRHQGSGTIVNISSLSGLVGIPYEGLYSATKHALEALSDALRFELAPSNIRVMLIEPGSFETGFVGNAMEAKAFGSDHVLRDEYERFWEAADGFIGGHRGDPQHVVDAISRAVLDPETSYRQLVGDDVVYAYESKHAAGLADTAPLLRAGLGLELA